MGIVFKAKAELLGVAKTAEKNVGVGLPWGQVDLCGPLPPTFLLQPEAGSHGGSTVSPAQGSYWDHLRSSPPSRAFTSDRFIANRGMVSGDVVGMWNDACASPLDQKEGQWATLDPWQQKC